MLFRNISLITIILFSLLISSCGNNTSSSVCDAFAKKLIDSCDTTKSEDFDTVKEGFTELNLAITDDEIQNATEASLKIKCEQAIADNNIEITDEEKTSFLAAVEATPDNCEAFKDQLITEIADL